MNKNYLLATVLLLLTTGIGCDQAITSEYAPQIVVTGYIYPGSGIDSVVLHTTTQFGQFLDDQTSAITSATVEVTVDGTTYTLLPAALSGRYYLPDSTLTVQGGKTYALRVIYHGDTVRASTTVPMPIHFTGLNDSLPASRILTLDTNNQSSFIYILTAAPIDNPKREYMLQVTALDTTFGKVHASENDGPPLDSNATTRFSFLFTGPTLPIYSRLFAWWGPNRITFLALDSNWVALQRQLQSGTVNTYQPSLNHIIGGYGVWASAAKDTVTVYLQPK